MKHLFPAVALVFAISLTAATTQAQIRKIPATVTDSFKEKYPDATGVEWRDKVSVFSAVFSKDGVSYEAKYNSKGEWLNTENEVAVDNLPSAVKEGFEKSKYAEWEIEKIHQIQLPEDNTQYRLLVGKTDLQKKNLLYSSKGRLLKDKITL
ncbi:PepSY-like domain-containing protein [Flavitalea sp.]|nr:PepSY-like domain-containing protein [Flavitalea sp.]